jgi:Mg-chelatase subunit ChlD
MGAPDLEKATAAIDAMRPEGGTPIGSAMIEAKRQLDRTGLSRRHLLLITDGENTNGETPSEVMTALARRPASEQPSIYFVAFDIEAERFQAVSNAGALVMAAANAEQLDTTLDNLLRGKILVER